MQSKHPDSLPIDSLLKKHFETEVRRFDKETTKKKGSMVSLWEKKDRLVTDPEFCVRGPFERGKSKWLDATITAVAMALFALFLFLGMELPSPSRIVISERMEFYEASETLEESFQSMEAFVEAFQKLGERK